MRITFTEAQLKVCLEKLAEARRTTVAHEAFSVSTPGTGYVQAVARPNGDLDVMIHMNVGFEKGGKR